MTPGKLSNHCSKLSITIRPATLADLPDVLAIELAAPEAPHWNRHEYARIVSEQADSGPLRRSLLVAAPTPEIPSSPEIPSRSPLPLLGFVVCSVLICSDLSGSNLAGSNPAGDVSTATIENLAVHPDARRRGIGHALVAEALAWAVRQRASAADLEVRASNLEALRLYRRLGFEVVGRRKAYYRQPVDDAILMRSTL